jgi:hypothetical protein
MRSKARFARRDVNSLAEGAIELVLQFFLYADNGGERITRSCVSMMRLIFSSAGGSIRLRYCLGYSWLSC